MTIEVKIGCVGVGSGGPIVIAGSCAVEPNYVALAQATADAGADILRAFVFKHRTSPHSFQGLGVDGLRLVREAKASTGLPVVIEVLTPDQVDQVGDVADALQVGSRNMQNVELLRAAGRSGLPVVLKRGMSATYEEWEGSIEYLEAAGCREIILCERGIRTFETVTRNTLDLAAIAYMRTRRDYPVIVDPSHAAGRRDLVPGLALAALAAGADGLEIEAHTDPDAALSDAAQAITMERLCQLCRARGTYRELVRAS